MIASLSSPLEETTLHTIQEKSNECSGCTEMFISVDGILAGVVYASDQLRTEAKEVIDFIHRSGGRVYIISGDRHAVVSHVAAKLGIPETRIHSSVLPATKAELVKNIKVANQSRTCMVGDGINDSGEKGFSCFLLTGDIFNHIIIIRRLFIYYSRPCNSRCWDCYRYWSSHYPG